MRFLPLFALLPAVGVAAPPKPVVREERQVVVDGRQETWRLEWQGEPKPYCMEPSMAVTAPCEPFGYGEEGVLDLVRFAGGREIDRLPLTPLFRLTEDGCGEHQLARLRRWPVRDYDAELDDTPEVMEKLRRRKPVKVLELEDLDGDGRALEWVLTIDAWNSSSFPAIAIELPRTTNRLRAIASVEKPQSALVLPRAELWRTLKSGGAIAYECGDHGRELADRLQLSHDDAGWHATRIVESCDEPGKVVQREDY